MWEVVPVVLEGRGSPQVASDLSLLLPAQLPGLPLSAPSQHVFVHAASPKYRESPPPWSVSREEGILCTL